MTPRARKARGQRYRCVVCFRDWYTTHTRRDWYRRWCPTCQGERTFERTVQHMGERVWPPPARKES